MGVVAGPLCLVAEDEALIAIGLEADFDDAGLEIAGEMPCLGFSFTSDAGIKR